MQIVFIPATIVPGVHLCPSRVLCTNTLKQWYTFTESLLMAANFIFIPFGDQFKKINFATLLYVRQTTAGTNWVTTAGTYSTTVSLEKIERSLPVLEFCRVNTSYMVSLSKIISFDNKTVQLPGLYIPLDAMYVQALRRRVRIVEPLPPPHLIVNTEGDLVYE